MPHDEYDHLRDSSDAEESLRTQLHESERKREWYEWEHSRNQQRRMRSVYRGCGCLLLIAIGVVIWIAVTSWL